MEEYIGKTVTVNGERGRLVNVKGKHAIVAFRRLVEVKENTSDVELPNPVDPLSSYRSEDILMLMSLMKLRIEGWLLSAPMSSVEQSEEGMLMKVASHYARGINFMEIVRKAISSVETPRGKRLLEQMVNAIHDDDYAAVRHVLLKLLGRRNGRWSDEDVDRIL